jgi:hypothetical protein
MWKFKTKICYIPHPRLACLPAAGPHSCLLQAGLSTYPPSPNKMLYGLKTWWIFSRISQKGAGNSKMVND